MSFGINEDRYAEEALPPPEALLNYDPPLSETELANEQAALDAAICTVEVVNDIRHGATEERRDLIRTKLILANAAGRAARAARLAVPSALTQRHPTLGQPLSDRAGTEAQGFQPVRANAPCGIVMYCRPPRLKGRTANAL
jgi:hypothetical protein